MVWWWWIIPAVVAVLGIALLIGGFGALFRGEGFKGGRGLLGGSLFLTLGAVAGLMGLNVQTYHRLNHENPVAKISLQQLGPQHFKATLQEPHGRIQDYDIRGDDWMLQARVLVWKPWANVLGLDSQYRLERLQGRYQEIEQERSGERSVYGIAEVEGAQNNVVDFWSLMKPLRDKSPFVDAVYGGSVYMPMVHNAEYEVKITRSGLIARPINDEAEAAVTHWDE